MSIGFTVYSRLGLQITEITYHESNCIKMIKSQASLSVCARLFISCKNNYLIYKTNQSHRASYTQPFFWILNIYIYTD